MKSETIEIHNCDYCPKYYKRKWLCGKHEIKCYNNPLNFRACFDCMNCSKKIAEVPTGYEDDYNGEITTKHIELFYCDAKKHFLYPPKAEHRNHKYDLNEENNPMPLTCELQKPIPNIPF